MHILIETIPHSEQRYPTVGDWYFRNHECLPSDGEFETDPLVVRVSELGDWREELCVAVHELVEVAIAKHRGVKVQDVDHFDMVYEADRNSKIESARNDEHKRLLLIDEPGDDPKCPIKREHSIATGVERILAAELEVDWMIYEKKVESLPR